jgi:hypothetical protein
MTFNSVQTGGSSTATNATANAAIAQLVITTSILAQGPDNMLYTVLYINDNARPADFELDLDLGNWALWTCQVHLLTDHQGFSNWLKGTLPQPDKTTHPKAYYIWEGNNLSLKAFLLSHISQRDYDNTCDLETAHSVF